MRIKTELVQKPDKRGDSGWNDHGIKETVRVRCRGSIQLPGGTTVSIKSREHVGIPKNMPERIDAAYRRLRSRVHDDLRLIVRRNEQLEMEDDAGTPDGVLDEVRETLVKQSCGCTAEVFAFIDRLAETGNALWARYPGMGVRGSLTGKPPRVYRETRGPDFENDSSEWRADGEIDCLCVLAVNYEAQHAERLGRLDIVDRDRDRAQRTDDEITGSDVHYKPMEEALRLAADIPEGADPPEEFTMDTAPWGLLVVASDDADATDWINENLKDASEDEARKLTTTYWSIKNWLMLKLNPVSAETVYIDAPADAAPPATTAPENDGRGGSSAPTPA